MVNGSAKKFLRLLFTEYYAAAVKEQIDSSKQLDEIEVNFHLSTMKPFHGRWLIALYNYDNKQGERCHNERLEEGRSCWAC